MVTKSFYSILFAAVTLFSTTLKADLPDTREALTKNVITPVESELQLAIENNQELVDWNKQHGATLTKLAKIVGVLNKPYDQQVPANNKINEDDVRAALKALWGLETDKAIGTVTDLKALIEEIRDRKRPGENAFQFSGPTRQYFFDDLIKNINAIIKASESEIDPITMMKRKMASVEFRKGPHDIDYPTITKSTEGHLVVTPEKTPDTAKVESLRSILTAAKDLDGALQSCPSPALLQERLDKLAALDALNEKEFVRIAGEMTKATSEYNVAVDDKTGTKKIRARAEAAAQSTRDKAKHDTIKAALLEALDVEVVSLDETRDTLPVGGKEVSSAKARDLFVEAILKDIRSEAFKTDHVKLEAAMEKIHKIAEVTSETPYTLKDFAGMPSAQLIAADINKRGGHVLSLTKLDMTKVVTLLSKVQELTQKADEAFTAEMTTIKNKAMTDEAAFKATLDAKVAELDKAKAAAEAKKMKLAKERDAVTACSTKLGTLIPHVKGLKKDTTVKKLEDATHDVQGITTESDVESLRPVQQPK